MSQKHILTPTDEYMGERLQEENAGFHHLMPHLRLGRISFEVFDRRRRESIALDPDIAEDRNSTAYRDKWKDDNAVQVEATEELPAVEAPEAVPQVEKKVRNKSKAQEKEEAVTKAKARKRSAKKGDS
jgi:hypothetical protein